MRRLRLLVISKCFNEVNECPLKEEARRATENTFTREKAPRALMISVSPSYHFFHFFIVVFAIYCDTGSFSLVFCSSVLGARGRASLIYFVIIFF